jgi:nucleotide-binding universal stress UspA family protein
MRVGWRKFPMKILVAYDGSPSADAAVEEVIRRPWTEGSEVRIVTVIEPNIGLATAGLTEVYVPLYERVHATIREDAYGRIQGALKKLQRRPDIKASYDLREGDAKRALLDAIREWKADLVIAGSRGANGLARLFLGSVCHALVTHAPCNVEIVKVPEAA